MNSESNPNEHHRTASVFPDTWELVSTSGPGRFVTREVRRARDGTLRVWESRRHRKKRGLLVKTDGQLTPASGHRRLRWWGWEPTSLQWWIAVIFTIGSALLVIGGLHPFFPNSVVHAVTFSVCGSTCFTIANYLAILEIVNSDRRVGEDSEPSEPKWRWWGWEPERIDFDATIFMFVGGLLFKLCFIFGMLKSLDWIETDILIWLPSLIGSLFFTTGSCLDLGEVNHRIWAFRPKDIAWWSCLTCLFGSIGYTVSSVYGFFGEGPIVLEQTWGNYVAVWIGSVMFLISSWLMIPEALDQTVEASS